jgi:hypothetical protein
MGHIAIREFSLFHILPQLILQVLILAPPPSLPTTSDITMQ